MLKEPIEYSYYSETNKKPAHVSGQERLQSMIDQTKNTAYEEMKKNPPYKDFLPNGKAYKELSTALRILDIKYATIIGSTNYIKLMAEVDKLAKKSTDPITKESTTKIFNTACRKVAPKFAEYCKKKKELHNKIYKKYL